jgi:hypothetical protein
LWHFVTLVSQFLLYLLWIFPLFKHTYWVELIFWGKLEFYYLQFVAHGSAVEGSGNFYFKWMILLSTTWTWTLYGTKRYLVLYLIILKKSVFFCEGGGGRVIYINCSALKFVFSHKRSFPQLLNSKFPTLNVLYIWIIKVHSQRGDWGTNPPPPRQKTLFILLGFLRRNFKIYPSPPR